MDDVLVKEDRMAEENPASTEEWQSEDGFAPGKECAECGGRCCKDKGCSLSPADMLRAIAKMNGHDAAKAGEMSSHLEESLRYLLADAEHGLYAIDHFSGPEGPLFYLRMRHKCYTFIGVDAMGECVALKENGCMFTKEERPMGGRFLKSSPDRHCEQHYTQEMMIKDWMPYQNVLRAIWKEFYPAMKADGTFDRCDDAYFDWLRTRNGQ